MQTNQQINDIEACLTFIKELAIIKEGIINVNNDMLFNTAFKDWLLEKKYEVQLSTYNEYERTTTNYILPFFENLKLKDITSEDINNFYKYRSSLGVKNCTVNKAHSLFYTFFKWATLTKEYITKNPMNKVKRLKENQGFAYSYYELTEIAQLLAVVKNHYMETPITLAAFLGLRRSEVAGLKWEDINFNRKTIAIKRKLTYNTRTSNDELSVELKTKSSYRTLVLPDYVLIYLQNLKKFQEETFTKTKLKQGYICLNKSGDLLRLDALSSTFRKIIKKNNLPHIRFHDLRHSCATNLMNLGYSIKEIQEWLGHSTCETTAKYYLHVNMKNKNRIADSLNTAFIELL